MPSSRNRKCSPIIAPHCVPFSDEEVARATSIVRYAPGSHFSPHIHGGGEEFLVLNGVFEDEHGSFPAGSYIRNPPTTSHKPGSEPGCIIFVKLWQFDPHDRREVRVNTSSAIFVPVVGRPGVEAVPLFEDDYERVRMEQWAAGGVVTLPASGGIELLVLDGDFTEGGELFGIQSWLRLPAREILRAIAGPHGCRVWIKSGHLANVRTTPTVS